MRDVLFLKEQTGINAKQSVELNFKKSKIEWVVSGIAGKEPRLPECADGIDNDGDGKTDYIEPSKRDGKSWDPGCNAYADASESKGKPTCADGIDNDGDGAIDALDPDCLTTAHRLVYDEKGNVVMDGRAPKVVLVHVYDPTKTEKAIEAKKTAPKPKKQPQIAAAGGAGSLFDAFMAR